MNAQQDRMISEKELAERWGITLDAVQRIRKNSKGPKFFAQHTTIRYLLSDVEKFDGGGLLSVKQLSERWGVSQRAVFIRISKSDLLERVVLGIRFVRYRLRDVLAYEQSFMRSGGCVVEPPAKK